MQNINLPAEHASVVIYKQGVNICEIQNDIYLSSLSRVVRFDFVLHWYFTVEYERAELIVARTFSKGWWCAVGIQPEAWNFTLFKKGSSLFNKTIAETMELLWDLE